MTIALICAMPMELSPLTKKLKLAKQTRNGVKMRVGELGNDEVVAIHTGMGPDLAHDSTEALLDAIDDVRGPWCSASPAWCLRTRRSAN